MALLNSLNSGVTALKTFSRSLEVIGDNIANVNTTAFKGSRARNEDTFSDLLQRSAPSDGETPNRDAIQVGTGVQLASVRQAFTQGSISTTGIPSDLAISGNGFFVVRNEATGEVFATRAGDFRVDDRGALMTNGGLNVQGLVDGSISYTITKGIDIAIPSAADLVADPSAKANNFGTVFKLGGTDTIASLAIVAGQAVSGTGIPSGATVLSVDSVNNTVTLSVPITADLDTTLAFGPTGATTPVTTAPFSYTRNLTLPGTVSGYGVKVGAFVSGTGIPAGAYVTKIIGPNQVEISAETTAAITTDLKFANLSTSVARTNPGDAGAGDVVGNIKVNDGVSFVNSSGASADQLDSFGFAGGVAPSITSFSINKDGTITCFLNDGKSFQRGRLMLKNFADPHALISIGNNLYSNFAAAGPLGAEGLNKTDNTPGNDGLGEIIGGALELSNVDLTQEFSDLILTQRSFQAASRIITVCDSVLEELVNLKR